MLDSGFMPLLSGKPTVFTAICCNHCLHYTLCLLQLFVACNLILLGDMMDSDPGVDY